MKRLLQNHLPSPSLLMRRVNLGNLDNPNSAQRTWFQLRFSEPTRAKTFFACLRFGYFCVTGNLRRYGIEQTTERLVMKEELLFLVQISLSQDRALWCSTATATLPLCLNVG
jgi:hypothetical protein